MTLAATIVEDLLTRVVVLSDADAAADVVENPMCEVPLLPFQTPAKRQDSPFSLRAGEEIGLLESTADHSRNLELARWPGVFCIHTNPEPSVATERSRREIARLNGLAVESACYDLGRRFAQRVSVSGFQPGLMPFGMTGLTGF